MKSSPIFVLFSLAVIFVMVSDQVVINNHINNNIPVGWGYPLRPRCTTELCRINGAGIHSMGHCSATFCNCANGKPNLQSCNYGLVFDANIKVCTWPQNVGC